MIKISLHYKKWSNKLFLMLLTQETVYSAKCYKLSEKKSAVGTFLKVRKLCKFHIKLY